MDSIFLGSPDIAIPFLDTLNKETNIISVITQPDRPKNRGQLLSPCPIKKYALDNNHSVLTPEKLSDIEDEIKKMNPQLGLAVAYGQLISPKVISLFKYGILNLHFSLLPKYRGAAPVQYALINGEEKTGVSLFWIDKGMDTGKILMQKELKIEPQDNSKTLFDKLIVIALPLIKQAVAQIKEGNIIKEEQKGNTSFAPKFTKKDFFVDFQNDSATNIHNRVRAFFLPPHARTFLEIGEKKLLLQITKTQIITTEQLKNISQNIASQMQTDVTMIIPIEQYRGFLVKCNEDYILLKKIKPEGKSEVSAFDYFNGIGNKVKNIKFS